MEFLEKISKLIRLSMLAVAAINLSSCSDTGPEDVTFRSSIIESYKAQFLEASKPYFSESLFQKASEINTSMAKLSYSSGGTTVAVCTLYLRDGSISKRVVSFDETIYRETLDKDKNQVYIGNDLYGHILRTHILFHEFGHCILDRFEHSCVKDIVTQVPRSLMNPFIKNTEYVYYNFQNFLDELFMNSPLFPANKTAPSGASKDSVAPYEQCLGESTGSSSMKEEMISFETKCQILPFTEEGRDGKYTCWHEESGGALE